MMSHVMIALGWFMTASAAGGDVLFEDAFDGKLKKGWEIVREKPDEWRIRDGALELRSQARGVWGGNDARNVMLHRPAVQSGVKAEVDVSQRPDHRYEQAGLLWYVHDDRFVKLISEHIDGKDYCVMARESRDTGLKNAVVAKVEVSGPDMRLRLEVRGKQVTGYWQMKGEKKWNKAATCELEGSEKARFGLFTQSGPPDKVRWARLDNFAVTKLAE
ncbi:MAG: beta-xylosidase family glycoside hydrolase [Planctomycetota bacterium]|jgi:regulation of enolase protein 1 (concanavalin A-like superfamily)